MVIWGALKAPLVIAPQCRTKIVVSYVSATRDYKVGRAITSPMSANIIRHTVTGRDGPTIRKCVQIEQAKCGRETEEFGMTLTPPLSGDEAARPVSVWLLGGQRVAASRIAERTPRGCRQDAAWPHESANVTPLERRL